MWLKINDILSAETDRRHLTVFYTVSVYLTAAYNICKEDGAKFGRILKIPHNDIPTSPAQCLSTTHAIEAQLVA